MELLVSIAIIGVLAGAAVIALGAVRSNASAAACSTDADAILKAEEAALTLRGGYVDEATLVEAGYLKELSTLHDVVVSGGSYQLVALGDCVADGSEVAAGDGESPEPDEAADEAEDEEAAKLAEQAGALVESDGAKAAEAKRAEKAKQAEAAKQAEEQKKADDDKDAEEKKKAEEKKAEEQQRAEAAEREAAELEAKQDASSSTCGKGQIDLNSADADELGKIEQLNNGRIKRLIDRRPFKSFEQLVELRVMTDKQVKELIGQGVACLG